MGVRERGKLGSRQTKNNVPGNDETMKAPEDSEILIFVYSKYTKV